LSQLVLGKGNRALSRLVVLQAARLKVTGG
jgi:hypothetical protein